MENQRCLVLLTVFKRANVQLALSLFLHSLVYFILDNPLTINTALQGVLDTYIKNKHYTNKTIKTHKTVGAVC